MSLVVVTYDASHKLVGTNSKWYDTSNCPHIYFPPNVYRARYILGGCCSISSEGCTTVAYTFQVYRQKT